MALGHVRGKSNYAIYLIGSRKEASDMNFGEKEQAGKCNEFSSTFTTDGLATYVDYVAQCID